MFVDGILDFWNLGKIVNLKTFSFLSIQEVPNGKQCAEDGSECSIVAKQIDSLLQVEERLTDFLKGNVIYECIVLF